MSPEVADSAKVGITEEPKVVESDGSFFLIECGSKVLELVFDLRGRHRAIGRARTKVDTVGGRSRIEGETTVLYQSALMLMRKVATEHGVSIQYIFSTSNPRMKDWALHLT